MRKLIFLILFLLTINFVSAKLFLYYNENIFTVKKFFTPFLEELPSVLEQPDNKIYPEEQIYLEITPERQETNPFILVTEKGFFPKQLEIEIGDKVIWTNNRRKLPVLLIGIREINNLRSSLKTEESYRYTFSEPGTYTYVDGIIIGLSGKIVVR